MASKSRQSARSSNQPMGDDSVSPNHELLNHWKQMRREPAIDASDFDRSNDINDDAAGVGSYDADGVKPE